jgi:hypothetical protein
MSCKHVLIGVSYGVVFLLRSIVSAGEEAADYEIIASSFLGGSGFNDSVVGARIQSDGTIVLAADLGPDIGKRVKSPEGITIPVGKNGCIIRLSPDGKKLLSLAAIAAELKDLALDEKDNLYLAAGAAGIIKMSPKADTVLWSKAFKDCTRVDAAKDGHFAALADGDVFIFDPRGEQLGTSKGKAFTNDLCIDGESRTVIFCGFRNANAFDGRRNEPVQIPYIRGLSYDGKVKWTDYDWDTDRDSDRFINKSSNNMADSRADRCAIGRDGRLYATFQVAGGNHIFRYSPTNIMEKSPIVGGDKHHQFYSSQAEHKNFFARYEPDTGKYLLGQQLCGRLSNNKANAVVTKSGEITADEEGCVYLVGVAAYGLPINLNLGGDYTGGGFLLVMSADFKTRLLCTRTCGGNGSPHAVDARIVDKKVRAVFGGDGMPRDMFVKDAIQPEAADDPEQKDDPRDGFFVVVDRKGV